MRGEAAKEQRMARVRCAQAIRPSFSQQTGCLRKTINGESPILGKLPRTPNTEHDYLASRKHRTLLPLPPPPTPPTPLRPNLINTARPRLPLAQHKSERATICTCARVSSAAFVGRNTSLAKCITKTTTANTADAKTEEKATKQRQIYKRLYHQLRSHEGRVESHRGGPS